MFIKSILLCCIINSVRGSCLGGAGRRFLFLLVGSSKQAGILKKDVPGKI